MVSAMDVFAPDGDDFLAGLMDGWADGRASLATEVNFFGTAVEWVVARGALASSTGKNANGDDDDAAAMAAALAAADESAAAAAATRLLSFNGVLGFLPAPQCRIANDWCAALLSNMDGAESDDDADAELSMAAGDDDDGDGLDERLLLLLLLSMIMMTMLIRELLCAAQLPLRRRE